MSILAQIIVKLKAHGPLKQYSPESGKKVKKDQLDIVYYMKFLGALFSEMTQQSRKSTKHSICILHRDNSLDFSDEVPIPENIKNDTDTLGKLACVKVT